MGGGSVEGYEPNGIRQSIDSDTIATGIYGMYYLWGPSGGSTLYSVSTAGTWERLVLYRGTGQPGGVLRLLGLGPETEA